MHPLTPNSDTGFLESINPRALANFTSDKKQAFLKIASDFVKNNQYPQKHQICEQLGISMTIFYDHQRLDPVFKRAWQEIKFRYEEALAANLHTKAMDKMGTLATLAHLRHLENGSWNGESRVTVTTDSVGSKRVSDALIIDADATISGDNATLALRDDREPDDNGSLSDTKESNT